MAIRVGIIDDKAPLRKGLAEVFEFYEEVEVVFMAENGQHALERLEFFHDKVDVLLMDIEMPVMDGVEATQQVKLKYPNILVLMLTVFDQNHHLLDAIDAGANGYILKGEKPVAVLKAVEDAMEGRFPMSPSIAGHVLQVMRREAAGNMERKKPEDYSLTTRETEILEHLVQTLTYQQIAEKLFVSPKTVRRHIENIYRKLHIHSKYAAIELAKENKWFGN